MGDLVRGIVVVQLGTWDNDSFFVSLSSIVNFTSLPPPSSLYCYINLLDRSGLQVLFCFVFFGKTLINSGFFFLYKLAFHEKNYTLE
jgi:hypothetical protein